MTALIVQHFEVDLEPRRHLSNGLDRLVGWTTRQNCVVFGPFPLPNFGRRWNASPSILEADESGAA